MGNKRHAGGIASAVNNFKRIQAEAALRTTEGNARESASDAGSEIKPDVADQGSAKECELCGGTGWCHGAQEWTPERMNQGTPYKSVRCDCKKAKSDE